MCLFKNLVLNFVVIFYGQVVFGFQVFFEEDGYFLYVFIVSVVWYIDLIVEVVIIYQVNYYFIGDVFFVCLGVMIYW